MSSVDSNKKLNSIVENDDILTEILVRLPLKSILRFKSVSRQWHSLISSPQFCHCLYPDPYLVLGLLWQRNSGLINPENDFVPLSENPTSPAFKTSTFVNHLSDLRILQSCHGLLICSDNIDLHRRDYYICNPTTNQFRALPLPPGGQDSTTVRGITLAYDPLKSPHYKVVCVRNVNPWQDYHLGIYSRLEIYSSESRSWRLSVGSFIAHDDVDFTRGVFWNGAVHWVNRFGPSLYFKLDDEEKLRNLPMPAIPDGWKEGRRLRYFDESREHMHLVEIYGPCTENFDVYEMETNYSRWFVKYKVDLNSIPIAFPEMITRGLNPSDRYYYRFGILGIIREAEDGESYMVLQIPKQTIRYNLNDNTFNKIFDFPSRGECVEYLPGYVIRNWFAYPYPYIETLAYI